MAKKNTLIFKPEEDKLVVSGSLSSFRYGTNKYDKDNDKYYVSVKCDDLSKEIRDAIRAKYFSNSKEKYIPDPLRRARTLPTTT